MKQQAAESDGKTAPEWSPVAGGGALSIDWRPWLDGGRAVDPYLVWADLTGFASFGNAADGSKLPVLMELRPLPDNARYDLPSDGCAAAPAEVDPVFCRIEIPTAYKRRENARLLLDQNRFSARVAPAMMGDVLNQYSVLRVQLGVPRLPSLPQFLPPVTQPTTDARFENVRPRTVVGIVDDGCAFAHPAFCNGRGETRVHALWDQNQARLTEGWSGDELPFDYGAELGHAALAKASLTAADSGDELQAYGGLDYAPVATDLDLRTTGFGQGPRRAPLDAMRRSAHGQGVMYLAAGVAPGAAPHPLDEQRALGQLVPGGSAQARTDFAGEWPLVFVQLPAATSLDTSGGSLGVHVLDGLRYILHRADRLPYDPESPVPPDGAANPARPRRPDEKEETIYPRNKVFVNISYGALAGCHDGTSILELAIADLAGVAGRQRWVAVAAGNGHRGRTHALLRVAEGEAGTLRWTVGADNPLESFLELWLPDQDADGGDFPAAHWPAVTLDVWAPGAVAPRCVRIGQGWLCKDPLQPGGPIAGVFFARKVVQGLRGTMALLAVGRTRAPSPGERAQERAAERPVAPHGTWRVDVALAARSGQHPEPQRQARTIEVHAWSERNDLLFGNLRAQQATVAAEVPVPEPTEFTPEAHALKADPRLARQAGAADPRQPRYSLASVAGLDRRHPWDGDVRLFAVGAYRLADGEVSGYSSGGPHRMVPSVGSAHPQPGAAAAAYGTQFASARDRPEFAAPADIGPSLPGLRIAGTRAGAHARLSGTSAAAPQALRALANTEHARSWGRPDPSPPALDANAQWPVSRPTTTPVADDTWRAGVRRLR